MLIFYLKRIAFCLLLVNWTRVTGIINPSLMLLSNNRVAVCGRDAQRTTFLKCYDIRTRMELYCAELKSDAGGTAEVKRAGILLLAVSCPYVYIFIPPAGNFILFSFFSIKNLDRRITKILKKCLTQSAVKI